MEGDLAFAGIAELAPRIAAGEVSPLALTEAALARIEARDGALNAFMTVTADAALEAARAAEAEIAAGRHRGPLHGVPLRSRTSSPRRACAPPAVRSCSATGCRTTTPPRSSA